MTPGSWWKHPKTGQRLIVPMHPSAYMSEYYDPYQGNSGRFRVRHGERQPVGRFPAHQEGRRLNLAWLLPDELMGAWKRYRPHKGMPVPAWVVKPVGGLNDFLLDGDLWVSVLGVRGHMVALTGLDPVDQKFTNWGAVSYTTLFIESSEAKKRLTPRYAKLRPTAWDRVVEE